MKKVTASNLVSAISRLPQNRSYDYPNPKNKRKIEIVRLDKPEGPIIIKRYNPSKGESSQGAKEESISSQMIWRIANAISEDKPINFDRVLGASYNTRSAFEALLLHTPEFYMCRPGRIEVMNSTSDVKAGHKHVLWLPNEPHSEGAIYEKNTNIVISEFSTEAVYDSLEIAIPDKSLSIEVERRHAQIQIALVLIGQQIGFRTWVARNDKGIVYKSQRLEEMATVIPKLEDEKMLTAYPEGAKAASLIDCVWFRNGKCMPAVMEVEHSTGVTSGLTRMKGFYDAIPKFQDVRWVIVAPDEIREKVMKEAVRDQFKELNAQFMPYSAVEELYSLCQRRNIKGINDEFLDCFMEPCIAVEREGKVL